MTTLVGADVESLCAKCGDVWHVVVAKVKDRIAKVQCKQCGAVHRLRPPGGAAPKEKVARTPRSRPKSAAPPAPSPPPISDGPVRAYAAAESFAAGERVRHPVFGVGVVTGSPGPGKIDVAFPGGPRILVQAKPPPALPPRSPTGDGDVS